MTTLTTPPLAPRDVRNFIPLTVLTPTIRQSSIKNLETCERYFLFRNLLGLALGRHSSAPYMGKVLHLALNGYWQGLDTPEVNSRVRVAVADHRNKVIQWASKASNVDNVNKKLKDLERETTISLCMAAYLASRFPKAHFEACLKCQLEVVTLEEEFSYESPFGPVGGRLDLVLRVVDTNTYIVLDFKTSSKPSSYLLTASFDLQPLLYASLVQRRWPGCKVKGFIHVVMKKPKYELQDLTWEDRMLQLTDWAEGRNDTVGTGEVFKSGPRAGAPKPRWEYASESAARVIDPVARGFFTPITVDPEKRLASRFAKHQRYTSPAPLLDSYDTTGAAAGHCTALFGSDCPYLPLCGSHEFNWARVVNEQYHVAETESETENLLEIDP